MVATVKLSTTWERITWEDPEDPDGYVLESGWADPEDPWNSFYWNEAPEGLVGAAWRTWADENVAKVELPLVPAARLVADFPGAVWGYRYEAQYSQDYRTGAEEAVTLHVEADEASTAVLWALAGAMERRRDEARRRMLAGIHR